MKAIAIMNNKGGVGKTITAINLADMLANSYHLDVVLVDCDGQANLTHFYLPGQDMADEQAVTVGDVLRGECEQVWSDNLMPIGERMQLLPSSSELYELDLQAVKDGVSAPERMVHFVDAAREDNDTDYMIFDCPPGYTVASVAALLAADIVVIPVMADAFSVDGVAAVMRQVRTIQRARPGVVAKALMTQTRTSDAVTAGEQLLAQMGVETYRTKIRRTDKVPESTMSLTPLRQYSPNSAATVDYKAWVRELLEEM